MGKLRKSQVPGCSPSDQMTYKRMLTQDFLSLITNINTSSKLNHQQIFILENMVFQSDPVENGEQDEQTRRMMIKTAKNGNAVVKVVNRVEEADETGVLDLSDCSLVHVPEAVYFILKQRNSEILKCNLSNNLISKITPKFGGVCFLNITSLDVSTNRLSALPSELRQCTQLTSVNISSNNFVEIPNVLMEIETVTDINAKNNFIAEVNENELETCESLEVVNLEGNPLSTRCRERIQRISRIRVIISDKKLEEWEDLSI